MNRTFTEPRGCDVDTLVGESEWVQRTRSQIARIAARPCSVLVTGPTGTGKELIARAIHRHSARAAKLFIPVDCAAIQGELFVSQLFGHVRGAFTGAQHASLGYFRAADGGTLFLDEVGELELEAQAKLLRAIQEKTVVPVGGYRGIAVDARIVAATNRSLMEEVARGRFREDLYYRLSVISIQASPLKDRPDDIETLAKHFLSKLADESGLPRMVLSSRAVLWLRSCDWPGNVRQLENLIERAAVYCDNGRIDAELLSQLMDAPPPGDTARLVAARTAPCVSPGDREMTAGLADVDGPGDADDRPCPLPSLAEVERQHISRVLRETCFNQTRSARLLGIDRRRLARKIKMYQIPMPPPKRGRPARCRAEAAGRGINSKRSNSNHFSSA
jgi:DNA-binding NtrC family response regulator